MKLTLEKIAKLVGGRLKGDAGIVINGVGDLETAGRGQISFVRDKSYLQRAKNSKASALMVPVGFKVSAVPVIETENPYLAFTKVLNIVAAEKRSFYKGVHPSAVIGKTAKLGKRISVGPYSVIGEDVSLGDNTVIGSNCYVGDRSIIGKDCFIHPNVSIREDSEIGNNVTINCGTVIGSDGHGYIPNGEEYVKIPQVGKVVIGDDVELGANVTIDRATLNKTVIGRGTKIDNQVHIAHNVIIGPNSMLLAHVTIAGSTKIGKHAIFSGQSGTIDNLKIGDNVIAAVRTAILTDIPDNSVVWGIPAKPLREEKRIVLALKNLPKLLREVKALQKKVEELEKRVKYKKT